MKASRQPIILSGQVYLDEKSNSYVVVTKKEGEMVTYQGQPHSSFLGIRGKMEDIDFIERFQPVDPTDLTDEEYRELSSYTRGAKLHVGFIQPEEF
jgi:hypothetical protein